ncbi:unnamed protein product [Linum tenue]|nr:unnamed protein product [Linum tenue]
MARTSLT